ncbi:uncharacterized protein LOC121382635 [Gigantopelta aegis]|uniref:uncharacterized protein LOC121382635 n=1 Tax=Gigantopelta aegis TaxID=1735272 RepID=UPI001B88A9A7|nr:uncharacterized protein LOC121382635 [Gigantopelta aegis]
MIEEANKETPKTNEDEMGRPDSGSKETPKTEDDDLGIKTWLIIGFGVLWILLLLGILIGAVVVGSMHHMDCDADFRVPIWLIVTGLVPLSIFGGCICKDKNNTSYTMIIYVSIIVLFMFSWLIVGTVWFVDLKSTLQSCDLSSNSCSKCPQDVLNMSLAVLIVEWSTTGAAFCAA